MRQQYWYFQDTLLSVFIEGHANDSIYVWESFWEKRARSFWPFLFLRLLSKIRNRFHIFYVQTGKATQTSCPNFLLRGRSMAKTQTRRLPLFTSTALISVSDKHFFSFRASFFILADRGLWLVFQEHMWMSFRESKKMSPWQMKSLNHSWRELTLQHCNPLLARAECEGKRVVIYANID